MKIIEEDICKYINKQGHLVGFSGNSYINRRGELVMGRGLAHQIKQQIPKIAYRLGAKIKHLGKYLMVKDDNTNIFVFQVKYHYKSQADLELIKESLYQIKELAHKNPNTIIHINYPGIGFGKLKITEVEPIINQTGLPNNVWIHIKKD